MTEHVLVTGGKGFVGRPAVTELRQRGFEVHVVGRETDLLDPSTTDALVALAPSHVLHLAWTTAHGKFWDDPANGTWFDATIRLARALRDAGATRFVFGGSCTQYEWTEDALGADGVAHEDTTPRRAEHAYGQAKERTVAALDAIDGLSVATGLIFFPYGPHEKPERLVPSITRKLLGGEPAETTTGRQVRDFLHVDDCGAAMAALVDSDVTGVVNIGSGEGHSVAEVATTIARILDREDLLQVGALPDRPGEPPRLVADVTRLRSEVGHEPRYGFDDGLRATVDWWRRQA